MTLPSFTLLPVAENALVPTSRTWSAAGRLFDSQLGPNGAMLIGEPDEVGGEDRSPALRREFSSTVSQ